MYKTYLPGPCVCVDAAVKVDEGRRLRKGERGADLGEFMTDFSVARIFFFF